MIHPSFITVIAEALYRERSQRLLQGNVWLPHYIDDNFPPLTRHATYSRVLSWLNFPWILPCPRPRGLTAMRVQFTQLLN